MAFSVIFEPWKPHEVTSKMCFEVLKALKKKTLNFMINAQSSPKYGIVSDISNP